MNLIGKIFVVLIFVFSLVFMTAAILTYATHRNWRDAVLNPNTGYKAKLTQAETRYKELEGVRQRLETELANERASRQRSVAALVEETTQLARRAEQLEKQEAALKQDTAKAVAAMDATHATLASLRNEIEGLRTDIETARNERNDNFNKAVKLEDSLAQASGKLDLLEKRNADLTNDLSRHQLALQDANIQLDRGGPPRLDGVILASRATGYVEISLGSDDGLEKGHELDVYRTGPTVAENKYLGKVRVVETQPDKAVAQILPNFKRGTIQKEDRVATRLQ